MCRSAFQERNENVLKRARGLDVGLPSTDEELDETEIEKLYNTSLERIGAIAQRSTTSEFENARMRTFEEFKEFLAVTRRGGVSVMDAGPEDVCVFIEGYWRPKHEKNFKGTDAQTKERLPSSSAIKNVIQYLSTSFEMLGRTGLNNPAKAEVVRRYRDGHKRILYENGIKQKKAVVFEEEKFNQLVAHLNGEIGRSTGLARIKLMMDRAACCYLWESLARGKECGELKEQQVRREENVALPGWSKTIHEEPSRRVVLQPEQAEEKRVTFLGALAMLLEATEASGHGSQKGLLFRPLNRRRNGFEDVPLQASALGKRMKKHFVAAGLYNGESMHSFRRSGAQHAVCVLGYTKEKVMELGGWASFAAMRGYIVEVIDRLKVA